MRANCGATERVEAIAADLRTPCARPVAELSLSLSLSLRTVLQLSIYGHGPSYTITAGFRDPAAGSLT